ncbi:MAG: metallopeptidase family protein [Candidatus Nanopelagicales bacterium]
MRSRAEQFDDLVLDSVERLDEHLGGRLDGVEFVVDEVPPDPRTLPADGAWVDDPVPLGHSFRATSDANGRVVVYRRPVEARADGRTDLAALIHVVVVQQVSELFGIPPEEVDPTLLDDD